MKKSFWLLLALFIVLAIACSTAEKSNTDSPPAATSAAIAEISPAEARPAVEAAYSQFIDVRTPEEYKAGHAYRTVNIPLDTLTANFERIEKNEPVYLICRSGSRSKKAAEILNAAGYRQAISISGGTEAWQAAGLRMAE